MTGTSLLICHVRALGSVLELSGKTFYEVKEGRKVNLSIREIIIFSDCIK